MEKRKHKRIKTRQFAKIGGKLAVLMDMSEQGVMVSSALLPKQRAIDVYFELEGEIYTLKGTVQWVRRKNSLNSLNRFGICLENPPAAYCQLVNQLER